MATINEIGRLLDSIKARWDRFNVNEVVMSDWHRVFSKVPHSALVRAIERYAEEAKYAPAICDIKPLIGARHQSDDRWSPDKWREVIHHRKGLGLVPCRVNGCLTWQPMTHAVKISGRWESKIEVCMDRLGATTVNEMIAGELAEFRPKALSESVASGHFKTKKYGQLLDDMMELAKDKQPQQVEVWA